MNTLHIAAGHSAVGSLREAIREADRDDEVLTFIDDLSCGPIDTDEASVRAAWWGQFHSRGLEAGEILGQFWDRVASADDHIVVWFSRHCACEHVAPLGLDHPHLRVQITARHRAADHRLGEEQ